MNHRITLIKRSAGVDAAGEPIESWADVATIWADVRFPSGVKAMFASSEGERAGMETVVKRVSIRIRARSDVDASWRVRYQGTEYEVKAAPLPDIDRQFAFLVCESVK